LRFFGKTIPYGKFFKIMFRKFSSPRRLCVFGNFTTKAREHTLSSPASF